MRVITVVCPGCEAPLRVQLDEDGYAIGECFFCDEPIEVVDGVVDGPEYEEELRRW